MNDRQAKRPVVFVTYNGVLDPLGKSQMLAYLERLNREWPVHIVSFERPHRLSDTRAVAAMDAHLEKENIRWTRLRYHKRPSLPATTYDMLMGAFTVNRILRKERSGMIHARGYVPMAIALRATRKVPVLFDIRGLQAEEYVDGGVWKEGELKWRLAKRSERGFFSRASGAVVLTRAIEPYVRGRFAEQRRTPPIEVVPCCVDLGRFAFDASARERIRAELGVSADTTVFVYSGSLGTWYMPSEMARLVREYRDATGERVCLLWLVNNDQPMAEAKSSEAGLSASEIRVHSAEADDVSGYLSAADVGLALIKSCFSKKSSSPTKYAEYLATGLPIVISRGVGDGYVIEDEGGAVALADSVDDAALRAAVPLLQSLRKKPRQHFRAVAEKLFDVDRVAIPSYRRMYEQLVLR